MINQYSYEELKNKVLEDPSFDNRMNLYKWFALYGGRWNGEYYDADDFKVKPIYEKFGEDDYEVVDVEII